MLRRMALWSTVGAVTLLTTVAIGQPVQDASTTTTTRAGVSGDAGVLKTSATTTAAKPVFGAPAAKADAGSTVATTASGDAGAPVAYVPTTAGTTTASAEKASVDAATYAVRLRDLEQRINELKEQIFRSKARLSLLAETVLQGVVAGSQTVIVHENKMSGSYKLVKVVYALDGAPILNRADEEGGLSERTEFDVYNGSIVPGEHTLTVNLEYRGNGYGIFSYLKGYRFKVRSSYSFSAPEGKAVNLRVVAYEKGGPTAPLEERPAISYQERVTETQAPQQVAEAQGGK
ncbi:MAG: Dihydrolipoamide acetyltransferase [Myxococcaceae bacterium]|nr:Dihydrolipoamide acetyltransferase [Myxococcaceae bacterium]